MKIEIWTGGQTGIDQAAWRAAAGQGFPTTGWMPRHYRTEDGNRPEFREMYGAREHESPDYKPRTIRNVADTRAVLWVGNEFSAGGILTLGRAAGLGRPILVARFRGGMDPADVGAWLWATALRNDLAGPILVAGNRGSSIDPETLVWAEQFLIDVFADLKARLS